MDAPVIDKRKLDAFLQHAFEDLSAGYAGVMISLGAKLGLYKAMAGAGPLTPPEVAERSGCAERYVREWLNAQAAGGYIDYHADSDRFALSPEQALVLADDDSLVYMPNSWQVPAAMWFDEPNAIDAFRTGKGIAWSEHDGRVFCGVASFYRNCYRGSLLTEWLPALEGVEEKLEAGIAVADVGCGHGHSTILMAQAFPNSRFHGFDAHPASLEEARRNAIAAGVADRVTFELARATDYPDRGYGLVCFFDCLHDMGDPVAAARYAARVLAADGTVMLIEPFANDRTADNRSSISQVYYAASTMLCCAHAISEGGNLVLGAQAGPARLAEVFREAGFGHFRRAAETPFNLILEVRRS